MVATETRAADEAPSFHRVARAGAANLAGAVVGSVANLALVVVIGRALSPASAGIVFATTSLFLLAEAAARLGADVGIVHFVAGAHARGRADTTTDYLRSALLAVAAVGALIAIVFIAAAPALLHGIVRHVDVMHGRVLMIVLGVAVPVAATYDVTIAATRGLGSSRPTVLLERCLRPGLQLAFVGATVAAVKSAVVVVAAWLAPFVIVAALAATSLRRFVPTSRSSQIVPQPDLKEFWRFTIPRSFTGILQIALQRLDIVLVGALRGPTDAAVYTAATRFVVVGQVGTMAVLYATQPRLAGLVATGRLEAARSLYRLSTAWIIGLTWPLFLAVLVAAPRILEVIGHSYRAGSHVMVVLSLAMLVSSACGLVDVVVFTVGKTTWSLFDTALALTINVAIDLALIPPYGIVGAAIGCAVAIIVRDLLALAQVFLSFEFHPVDRLGLRVAVLAVVFFACIPGATALVFGSGGYAILLALAAGFAAYAAAIWRLRGDLQLRFL